MSIANEITRIKGAKEELRALIEKRGAAVPENSTIDSYPQLIENTPCAVKGTFTPEEDTQVFSIGGLPFEPKFVYVGCNDLYSLNVKNSIVLYSHGNGLRGTLLSCDGVEILCNYLSPTVSLADWTDTGYSFNASATKYYFKAGYTYDYIIAGGLS